MTVNPAFLKLPRKIEAEPRQAAALEARLAKDLRLLWEGGNVRIPHLALEPALAEELARMQRFGQVEHGLERIEKLLESEKRGLEAARTKQGAPPPQRVSRLLLISNDGAERFYRSCESLLAKHSDRLLCLWIDVPAEKLAQAFLGQDKTVKAVLISEKEAVISVLLSLI